MLELFVVEVVPSSLDFLFKYFHGFALERQVAADEGVQDDSARPNIHFLVVLLAFLGREDLRGHVERRSLPDMHITLPT